jgi:hypothetical protein
VRRIFSQLKNLIIKRNGNERRRRRSRLLKQKGNQDGIQIFKKKELPTGLLKCLKKTVDMLWLFTEWLKKSKCKIVCRIHEFTTKQKVLYFLMNCKGGWRNIQQQPLRTGWLTNKYDIKRNAASNITSNDVLDAPLESKIFQDFKDFFPDQSQIHVEILLHRFTIRNTVRSTQLPLGSTFKDLAEIGFTNWPCWFVRWFHKSLKKGLRPFLFQSSLKIFCWMALQVYIVILFCIEHILTQKTF